ncbi:hypothetical protein N8252_03365 [Ulvibacter sp.]|nr:hypothetical protein [Ulvibacter sp.]
MFNWKKLGRVYNPYDFEDRPDWMFEFAQAPSVLVFDKFIRVFVGTRPKRDLNGQYVTYTSFIDLDRQDLFKIIGMASKPVLELGNFGCFDEFGTYPLSVIKKNEEIWAYYAGWTRCESVPFNVGIGYAISKDNGVSFQKPGDGPILPYSLDEPFTLSGPKIKRFEDKYYLFYIAGKEWLMLNAKPEISHKIRMAISDDGIKWDKVNKDIVPNGWDENESQASPDVFYSNGKYHMFFCGWVPSSFRETKTRTIGYAYSKDLINWTRDDTKVGIHLSEEGWDSQMLAYPHVFELDGDIYMIYIGNEVGKYGFGLAKLNGNL